MATETASMYHQMMADLEKEVLRLLDSANCLKIEKDVIADLHQRLVSGEKLVSSLHPCFHFFPLLSRQTHTNRRII